MKYLSPWVTRVTTTRVATKRVAIPRIIAAMLMFTLCGVPEVMAQAAQTSSSQPQPSQVQPTSSQAQQTPARPSTTLIPDPAQAPLQPVTSTLPDTPSASPQQQQPTPATTTAAEPQTEAPPLQAPKQPLGAAAAEVAPPTGGAASKPAGTAIAPAKQRQVRSLLLKLSMMAAAGAALGTVYGLTRATSSVPPGATSNTTTAH